MRSSLSHDMFQLNQRLRVHEHQPLSGGITATGLKIIDNQMGQLEFKGNFKITIKVLNLCSTPAPRLPSLLTMTRNNIVALIQGPVYVYGIQYYKYDIKKNAFNQKIPAPFTAFFNFNFKVAINMVGSSAEIRGNDFVIAVVDKIGWRFKDRYGNLNDAGGFSNEGSPAIVAYESWLKDWKIATHEFFHTLSLADSELPQDKGDLMYHLGGSGDAIKDSEKRDMIRYIIGDLKNLANTTYQNPGLNTLFKLRQQLNNPANEVSYNRNNFR